MNFFLWWVYTIFPFLFWLILVWSLFCQAIKMVIILWHLGPFACNRPKFSVFQNFMLKWCLSMVLRHISWFQKNPEACILLCIPICLSLCILYCELLMLQVINKQCLLIIFLFVLIFSQHILISWSEICRRRPLVHPGCPELKQSHRNYIN